VTSQIRAGQQWRLTFSLARCSKNKALKKKICILYHVIYVETATCVNVLISPDEFTSACGTCFMRS